MSLNEYKNMNNSPIDIYVAFDPYLFIYLAIMDSGNISYSSEKQSSFIQQIDSECTWYKIGSLVE